MTTHLGVDVGGSAVKGAPVDMTTGELVRPPLRIPTPEESTPQQVAAVISEIVDSFATDIGNSPIGLAIPAPVVRGSVPSMANLHQTWAGLQADLFFEQALGQPVVLVNDADAAGLAEVHYGAAAGHPGLVIVTTLGTGIGTAIVHQGVLVPNAELGHLELNGHDAEKRAAASVKDKEGLSYEDWANDRLQPYYAHLEMLFSPDLIVVGGGVSANWSAFGDLLRLRTPVVPARLRNAAGIVGAARAAQDTPRVQLR